MKKKLQIIALFLVSILIFASCNNGGGSVDKDFKEDKTTEKIVVEKTNYDLFANNKTAYKILVPDELSSVLDDAIKELSYFLFLSAGIEFDVVKSSEFSYNSSSSVISLGKTAASAQVGIAPEYEKLLDNGYIIKTIDQSVFIVGAKDLGALNGVYEFLHHAIDYHFYAVDEFSVTKEKTVKVPKFDLTVIPSFNWREVNYGEMIRNKTLMQRLRFNATEDIYVNGHNCHYSYTLIPPTKYYDKHKDWFNDNVTQLCYSNKEMLAEYVKNLKEVIRTNDADTILLGHEDNIYWCSCDECSKSSDKYGTDSAVLVKFTKTVSKQINDWIKTELPGRKPLNVIMFAYQATVTAPVKFNESTGEYLPIDDDMLFDENTGIMFAPIGADFSVPLYHEKNQFTYAQYMGWKTLTDRIHIWSYNLYMNHALVLNDTFSALQDNYRLYVKNGTTALLDQTEHFQPISAGFGRLKAYVQSNLQWDVNANMEELMDDFFENYFKEANEPMRKYFNELRHWNNYLYENTEANGNVGCDINKAEYWSKNMLEKWLEYFDLAYNAIEIYKSDVDMYNKMRLRIERESMGLRYLLIDNYASTYVSSKSLEMKQSFKKDFYEVGLSNYSEIVPIDSLWKEWGVL